MKGGALLLVLAATIAAGVPSPGNPPAAPKGGGWKATRSSLLLFDGKGRLVNEIGLGDWHEDIEGNLAARRRMTGGVSADGRFAWHWQKVETVHKDNRETIVGSTRTLVYFGTAGQILWSNRDVEAPEGVPPLIQSRDGETALIIESSTSGYSAAAFTFTGNRIMSLPPGERLESAELTGDGRYALILWSRSGQALLYTLLDLKRKIRKDIPAAKTPLGRASLWEDGSLRSRGKLLYRFP